MSGILLQLRRRIRSVQNTQKLTKAMKTVSAAKLRRATTDLRRTEPYLQKLEEMLALLLTRLPTQDFPLFRERSAGRNVLVVVSADKGLCGSFNSHLLKAAEDRIETLASPQDLRLVTVGNKAFRHFTKHGLAIEKYYNALMMHLTVTVADQISDYLQNLYMQEEIRAIEIVSTRFLSASRQQVARRLLYPLDRASLASRKKRTVAEKIIFEPDSETLFRSLLPLYCRIRFFRMLLESMAAEQAARMMAMDLATRNASDMIKSLRLKMNKMRQAAITKELLEIITATEALRK